MAKTKTPKTAADGTQQPKDPTQQPERTYFQRRVFDEIGVTPELNRIKLKFDCGDQMRTSTATMDIFSEDKNGNIRILVYSIDGWVRQYVDPHQLSDTVLTMRNENNFQMHIPVSKVTAVDLSGKNKIVIENGKFVLVTKSQFAAEQQHRESAHGIQDPNYAVGKALRATGKTSLIVGIPSLIAGTILIAYGRSGSNVKIPEMPKQSDYKNTQAYLEAMQKYSSSVANNAQAATKDVEKKANCTTAGCVLMPFGAALTVVGIPLCVKGKQLMELKVNYTGNGAGLALAW